MACQAGDGPSSACGQPDDGAVYLQTCPQSHQCDTRMCSFHALMATTEQTPWCAECWRGGALNRITIRMK